MNGKVTILFIVMCIILSFPVAINAAGVNIIPRPAGTELFAEKFIVSQSTFISYNGKDAALLRLANYLSEIIKVKTGVTLDVRNDGTKNSIFLNLKKDASGIENNGYLLTVNAEKTEIKAKDIQGIFYGIQSLRQIVSKDKDLYIPGCRINDFPRFEHRGFMLDASRHFQSVGFVKKVLDVMALLKLNKFHWHLTDDEGWRIESKKYPALNLTGSFCDSLDARERNGYYTADEIRQVLSYAKSLYIEVIPEIELPGHSLAVMMTYPELLCPTDKDGKAFCAGNKKSYEFLKNAVSEIISIFNPRLIHVGGDERPKGIWEKCPDCKAMIAKHGLGDENMLQNYFMKEICTYISKNGAGTVAWMENIKDGIPDGQIVEGWHPGDSWEAAKSGRITINADNLFTYFDYPSYPRTDKPDWMPVLNLKKVYSFDPVPDSLNEDCKKFVIGSECALWTELILENDVQYQIFPRILGFSEVVWSKKENKNYDNFIERVKKMRPLLNSMGFEYEKGEW